MIFGDDAPVSILTVPTFQMKALPPSEELCTSIQKVIDITMAVKTLHLAFLSSYFSTAANYS
jgi:hypothetical protein